MYGADSGWLVKATFERRAGIKIAIIKGIYNTDSEGNYCYVVKASTQAVKLDKQVGTSILHFEPNWFNYIVYSTMETAGYIPQNIGKLLPET